jgi:glycosyltransferase involved in cell wall biosynthesis
MISIVLPAYKARFFAQAIDSILAQTFTDFELIIVNDASPDDLDAIVGRYSDPRIKYYKNPHNIGGQNLVANWNHCLSYATGEFVVLASDDDIYHRDYLQEMYALTRRYPNVDLFHCRWLAINANGDVVSVGDHCSEYESDIDFIYQRAIRRRHQTIPDFMMRRSRLIEIGGFTDYPRAWYSDEMTTYRLALGKGVAASSRMLFYWRNSDINISNCTNDIEQKAQASRLYLDDMLSIIDSNTPPHESPENRFMKLYMRENIAYAIGRQLISDLTNAKWRAARRVRRNPTYAPFFCRDIPMRYRLKRLQRLLHL